ncbi:hypothetical protein RB195_011723 [Necator americanus]|uniref:Uncharacterized protein n=1 Tax=Necator americanus TaxID=51031 RepID=A0ABR1D3Q1_NECAM
MIIVLVTVLLTSHFIQGSAAECKDCKKDLDRDSKMNTILGLLDKAAEILNSIKVDPKGNVNIMGVDVGRNKKSSP